MTIFRKDVVFDKLAREKLLEGINIVADAVSSTLGPRGRNVAVDQFKGIDVPPTVLHDGVSVARSINLEDRHADMGARLLKAAALKTNEISGDGTTSSTILARAIVNEAFKNIGSGANPMALKKEIEDATEFVLSELSELRQDIKGDKELEQVATISAIDPEIGKLVAGAIKKVGESGVVTVEEGKTTETTVEFKQGMEIDRGYLSPYFVTNRERVEAVIENPYILLTDKRINYAHEIMPFLERFIKTDRNLVIFAGELIEEAMSTLVVNKLKGMINVCAIQSPAFGGRRVEELDDIAVLTGGHPILEDSGREIKDIEIEELGRADRIIIDRDKSIIINGHGGKGEIKERINDLKEQIKLPNTDFDKEIKEERLAKLSGGVAVVYVGAATEVELKEKKERVIDAIAATKAGLEEGVVGGGETALLYIAMKDSKELSTDGGRILKEALKAPFKKLLENAGLDYAEMLQRLSGKDYPWGIDVLDGKAKNLIEAGIIDPHKVVRSSLENAVSVAVMCVTTECLVADIPKEDEN